MNKQKIIILSAIVFITFVIGVTIVLLITLASPKQNAPIAQTSQVPNIQSAQLYCTSTTSNQSLTVTWILPSSASTYSVYGQLNDVQAQPVSFGPLSMTQNSYVLTNVNGIDTYQVSIWLQDSKGNKSSSINTNQIISSQCTSGTEPTPPQQTAVPTTASTMSPTMSMNMTMSMAMTTSAPTHTPTPTVMPTTAHIVVSTAPSFNCNTFTLSQNGTTLSSATVQPGSGMVTINPGITGSGTISYTNAKWSISPSSPGITASTDGSNATWMPPADTTNGTSYMVTLTGATDSNGNTQSLPCTVTISLTSSSTTLPNTGNNMPAFILSTAGMIILAAGLIIFLK